MEDVDAFLEGKTPRQDEKLAIWLFHASFLWRPFISG